MFDAPQPLTALLFEVMVTVVGWARDYSPLQYKAQPTFPAGTLHPGSFYALDPSEFPRMESLGSSVNRNTSRAAEGASYLRS